MLEERQISMLKAISLFCKSHYKAMPEWIYSKCARMDVNRLTEGGYAAYVEACSKSGKPFIGLILTPKGITTLTH